MVRSVSRADKVSSGSTTTEPRQTSSSSRHHQPPGTLEVLVPTDASNPVYVAVVIVGALFVLALELWFDYRR